MTVPFGINAGNGYLFAVVVVAGLWAIAVLFTYVTFCLVVWWNDRRYETRAHFRELDQIPEWMAPDFRSEHTTRHE